MDFRYWYFVNRAYFIVLICLNYIYHDSKNVTLFLKIGVQYRGTQFNVFETMPQRIFPPFCSLLLNHALDNFFNSLVSQIIGAYL